MSLVGVISDTHGTLLDVVLEAFAEVDHIIHAGDVGDDDILFVLGAIAPLTAVRGNIDHVGEASGLPSRATLDVDGVRFVVQHHPFTWLFDRHVSGADVLISGHTHRPAIEKWGRVLMVDPGSCTRPRSGSGRTLALVETVKRSTDARILEIG